MFTRFAEYIISLFIHQDVVITNWCATVAINAGFIAYVMIMCFLGYSVLRGGENFDK